MNSVEILNKLDIIHSDDLERKKHVMGEKIQQLVIYANIFLSYSFSLPHYVIHLTSLRSSSDVNHNYFALFLCIEVGENEKKKKAFTMLPYQSMTLVVAWFMDKRERDNEFEKNYFLSKNEVALKVNCQGCV